MFPLASLRGAISVVSQEVMLFDRQRTRQYRFRTPGAG